MAVHCTSTPCHPVSSHPPPDLATDSAILALRKQGHLENYAAYRTPWAHSSDWEFRSLLRQPARRLWDCKWCPTEATCSTCSWPGLADCERGHAALPLLRRYSASIPGQKSG